jgi:hypothetical protein
LFGPRTSVFPYAFFAQKGKGGMMGGKSHDYEDYGKGKGKGGYETEDVSVIVSDFTVRLFLIESLLHIHFVFLHTFYLKYRWIFNFVQYDDDSYGKGKGKGGMMM